MPRACWRQVGWKACHKPHEGGSHPPSVVQLPVRQWSPRPIGEAGGFIQRFSGDLLYQRFITGGFAKTADHRRHLCIENGCRQFSCGMEKYFHILPAGVKDLQNIRIEHQIVKRAEIEIFAQCIDGKGPFAIGNLHQTQL